jgi:pimeloyl-ACP methyl ester carboxylesterase
MQDMAERLVVGTLNLDLRRWPGAGFPILLLHEALGAATIWRDFPDRLSAATGTPVIAWSRPGFGRSDPLPGHPRGRLANDYLHREAERVVALMDALGLARAHLHGHSDGAAIALIVAATAPERIAGLVLEAPHVTVEERTAAAIVAVKALYDGGDLRERLARHHADPDRVFANWCETWLDPAFRSWSIEDLLPRIAAPALLIQGIDDPYFSLGQLDRIARAVPGTHRLELAGCGHAPYREQTQAVLDAAAGFLASLADS